MNQIFKAFLLLAIIAGSSAHAQEKLRLRYPGSGGWPYDGKLSIQNPTVEITPEGLFAKYDFTFELHIENSTSNDSAEAILDFDLPRNSFIHDSWLWLDENTIIQADLMERRKAAAVYNNIVQVLRTDPSLLYKTSENTYRLHVYPILTNYDRRVKITYYTPFNWRTTRVNVPLPLGILSASVNKPDLKIIVNHDSYYSAPSFPEILYDDFITSSTSNTDELLLTASAYNNKEMHLNYNTSLHSTATVWNYPTAADEGYYQMVVNPATVAEPVKRHVVFIVDRPANSDPRFEANMRSAMINHLNPTDSFNVFYVNNAGNIVQKFPGWMRSTSAQIVSCWNSIPSTTKMIDAAKFEALLIQAHNFCGTKQPGEAQTILITENSFIGNATYPSDSLIAHVQIHPAFTTHKLNVVSSGYSFWNDIFALYRDLANLTGGTHFEPAIIPDLFNGWSTEETSYRDDYNNLSYALLNISKASVPSTIELPMSSGFTYAGYSLSGDAMLNPYRPYLAVGRYYGSIQTNSSIHLQALMQGGLVDTQLAIANYIPAGYDSKLPWVYQDLQDMIGNNASNSLTAQIISNSIADRVMCSYTSFLALDTGDTLKFSEDASTNEPIITNVPGITEEKKETITCSPNPFTSHVTIMLPKGAQRLDILNLNGQVIRSVVLPAGTESYVWNGLATNGDALPAGLYIIRVQGADKLYTVKVIKQ